MIEARCSREDLQLFEILRNPVLCGEFIYNYDNREGIDPEFLYTFYQRRQLADFSAYQSFCQARSTGKTVTLTSLILWFVTFNVFPKESLLFATPSKIHLLPVWDNLTKMFRSNSFLKNFISPASGINSSNYTMKFLNYTMLDCRIAGQSGTGANFAGAHIPVVLTDECLTRNVKITRANGGATPIEFMDVGDKILAWDGEKLVEDTIVYKKVNEAKDNLYNVFYAGGKLTATNTHRFYTDKGYVELKNLSVGDTLYISESAASKKYWTKDEEQILVELAESGLSSKDIAKKLGRTTRSIERKLFNLNFSIKDLREPDFTEEEFQIIAGSLLGDGYAHDYLYRAEFVTNHSLKQKPYVDWLYSKLSRFCTHGPVIKRNGGYGDFNYTLQTRAFKKIKELHTLLYKDNIKTVTREYLDLLSPLAIAVWFMDDGCEVGHLSTHSFGKAGNEVIRQWFIDKHGIEFSLGIDKGFYFLVINSKNRKKLRDLIAPYVKEIPFMLYKIGEGNYQPYVGSEEPTVFVVNEKASTLKPVKILKINKNNKGFKKTYSIETERNHNYFANNVLVKNCGYFPWAAFQEMQPCLNTFTSGYREVVAGVPTGIRESAPLFYADQISSEYSKHRASAFDNPRLTEEDHKHAEEQYGGKDNPDYVHYHLGQHGLPVYALFDRGLMSIDSYPVYKLVMNGQMIGESLTEYTNKLSVFPGIPEKKTQVVLGIDLGYTEPTAIIIMFTDHFGRLKFHGRIQLEKVSYTIQERLIDFLDTKFEPIILGMDKGSAGISTYQHLVSDKDYLHKNYEKRLIPVDFSGMVTLGVDADGEEVKSKTKPFATTVLQDYTNNHKIIYSSTDLEMISELERMTYTKNVNGDIAYRTLTVKGGKKGEDHFTSALLCGTLAYYLTTDFMAYKPERKSLARPRWF